MSDEPNISDVFKENTSITSFDELSYFTGLTTIPNDAFYYCRNLTSISMPSNVTEIGSSAFMGCKLSSLTIPKSVTTIGTGAFTDCGMTLTAINVESGNSTFDSRNNCNAIIKTGTNTLLWGCNNTIIPNSVTSIGNSAFSHCMGLTSVSIPEGVTSIGDYAFYNCESLKSIVIPDNVVSIGNDAFWHCDNLASLTLGSSVESIGTTAFQSCDKLTSVTVKRASPISITERVFTNRAHATLYVPYGSKSEYQSANYWKEFKEILEPVVVDMSANEICTFCSAYDLDFSGVSGLKAYIVSGFGPSTGKLTLTQVTAVPAGEGLLLRGAEGSYEVPYTTTDMVYSNLLKGVTTTTEISPTDGDQTNFILANGKYGINFYTLSESGDLAAGKAYLQLPTSSVSSLSRPITLVFDDESTDIEDICEEEKAYNVYYDLQGRRIAKPNKGMYIVNGKKVIIK